MTPASIPAIPASPTTKPHGIKPHRPSGPAGVKPGKGHSKGNKPGHGKGKKPGHGKGQKPGHGKGHGANKIQHPKKPAGIKPTVFVPGLAKAA